MYNALLIEWKILDFFEKIRSPFMNILNYLLTTLLGGVSLIIIMFLVYWIFNKQVGKKVAASLFLSMTINNLFKGLIMRKRPFEHEGKEYLRALSDSTLSDHATGSSFPSGHSQNSSSLYSSLFANYNGKRRSTVRVVLVAVILTVALTRLYLGVHFPTDVISGVLLGILSVLIVEVLYKKFNNHFDLIWLVASTLSLTLVFLGLEKDGLKSVSIFFGAGLGNFLENRYVKFSDTKCIKEKLTRLTTGLLVVGGIYLIYSVVPNLIHNNMWFIMVCHFMISFSGFYLVPLIFTKIKKQK